MTLGAGSRTPPASARVGLWLLIAAAALGCGQADTPGEDYLLRSGDLKVSAREYLQAFEIVKTAYPGSIDPRAPELMAAHLRLLEEMKVELVMQRRSEELGLSIAASELDAAVERIKNDYPPGVFEQTLLESALSFETWKRRLRSRLLLEALMDRELREQVSVTAEEVAAYYDQHYRGGAAAAESEAQFQQLKETLVADLRQKKIEDALAAWAGSLKQKFPVEINQPLWDKLLQPQAADAAPPESQKPAGT